MNKVTKWSNLIGGAVYLTYTQDVHKGVAEGLAMPSLDECQFVQTVRCGAATTFDCHILY